MTIFDLIGNTPIVELTNIPQFEHVKIYGKLEGLNPGGSVKDRAALLRAWADLLWDDQQNMMRKIRDETGKNEIGSWV